VSRQRPKDRKQQLKAILAHAKGAARNSDGTLQRANNITLHQTKGPTLAEIEAKYGPIERTSYGKH
jgi:hypothetical protein